MVCLPPTKFESCKINAIFSSIFVNSLTKNRDDEGSVRESAQAPTGINVNEGAKGIVWVNLWSEK